MKRIKEAFQALRELKNAYRECKSFQEVLIVTMAISIAFSSIGRKWSFNKSNNLS